MLESSQLLLFYEVFGFKRCIGKYRWKKDLSLSEYGLYLKEDKTEPMPSHMLELKK